MTQVLTVTKARSHEATFLSFFVFSCLRGSLAIAAATAAIASACATSAVSPPGMIRIPGGTFHMGCSDCGMPDAEPVHLVCRLLLEKKKAIMRENCPCNFLYMSTVCP